MRRWTARRDAATFLGQVSSVFDALLKPPRTFAVNVGSTAVAAVRSGCASGELGQSGVGACAEAPPAAARVSTTARRIARIGDRNLHHAGNRVDYENDSQYDRTVRRLVVMMIVAVAAAVVGCGEDAADEGRLTVVATM